MTSLLVFSLLCSLLGVPVAKQNTASADVSALVEKLKQPATTDDAVGEVRDLANNDLGARQYLIHNLPKLIEDPPGRKVWINAVRLAGELKAVETIPSLKKALARGKQTPFLYSMTGEMRLDDDVVGKALSQIGDPAIPVVKDSLLDSKNVDHRRRAILILGNINTPASRSILEKHLTRETDQTLRSLTLDCLRS